MRLATESISINRKDFKMDAVDGFKVFAFGIAMLLTVSLNGLVLMTIIVEKRPHFSTKCIHVFVTNLAICQFLIGLIVMPFVELSTFYDGWIHSRTLCQFNGFTTSTCFYTAVLMLCAISLDRFVAIVLATKYQKLLTKKRGYIIIFFIWIVSSVLSLPPLIGWSSYQYHPGTLHCSPVWIEQCSYFYFTFTISVIIPTSLTVLSYLIIFWKVRKHRKRVSMWQHAGGSRMSSKMAGGESDMEMSHIVTIHRSPAMIRKAESALTGSRTELFTNSPAISHKSLSPEMNTQPIQTKRFSAESAGEEQRGDAGSPRTFFKKRRFLGLQTEDVFYTPKKSDSTPLSIASKTVTIKEFGIIAENNPIKMGNKGNTNVDDCVVQTNVDKIQGSNVKKELNEAKKEHAGVQNNAHASQKLASPEKTVRGNRIAEAPKRKNEAVKGNPRKTSLGRLMASNRNHNNEISKLSEDDTNELLNISAAGGESNRSSSSETTTQKTALSSQSGAGQQSKRNYPNQEVQNGDPKETSGSSKKLSSVAIALITSLATNKDKEGKSRRVSRRKVNRVNKTLREYQVAKTGAILLSVFMVCYGPYTVVHLCHIPFPVPIWAQHLAMWCVFLNSILTPVIYGLMNKETRTKIKAAMWKRKR